MFGPGTLLSTLRPRRPSWSLLVVALLLAVALPLAACGPSREQVKKQQEQAKYHYDLAYGHYFDQQKANADAALQEVLVSLDLNPDESKTHLLAGLIFMGRESWIDAERHYKRAIELQHDNFLAQNNLGAVYLATERFDEAITAFTALTSNVLYVTPGHGHNNLGWAWYKKGDLEKAKRHFRLAINLSPQLCPAYNNLGLVYFDEGNMAKATRYLERGLKRCTTYAEPNFHLGRVLARQGHIHDARIHFARCLELAGESALADRCERLLNTLPPDEGGG